MKKLIGTALFILLFSIPGDSTVLIRRIGGAVAANIQYVQSTSGSGTGDQVVNFVSDATSGNMIVVAVRAGGTSLNAMTVTDDASNTYSTAISSYSSGPSTLYIGYALNITGGAISITLDMATSSSLRWAIHEYSSDLTFSLDKTSAAEGTSDTADSGSPTSTIADALLFGATGLGAGSAVTEGTGFTEREEVDSGKMQTQDDIVSATGAYNSDCTFTSDTWLAGLAIFGAN